MKKVKELKKWIELYGEVHAAAEELELAYEYVKEEIITEEEVDAVKPLDGHAFLVELARSLTGRTK